MKNKFCRVFFLCAGVLTVTLSACGNKSEVVTSLPEEGLKTTVTLTMAPTLTPTTTPEPAETATEIPMAEDTYEKGMIQNEFFASEWMNLRFTSQPGFEFGSREEVEMYARYGEEAMVEVYTQRLTKEEQNLTEEEYLPFESASGDGCGFAISGGVADADAHRIKQLKPDADVKIARADASAIL